MAFADLNPLGALWQAQGLHALLQDNDVPAGQAFTALLQGPASAAAAQRMRPAPSAAGARPCAPQARGADSRRETCAPDHCRPASGTARPARPGSQAGPQGWQQAGQTPGPAAPPMPGQARAQGPVQAAGQESPQDAAHQTAGSTARTGQRPPSARQDAGAERGRQASPAGSATHWRPQPPHVWPVRWREQLQHTRPGQVVWTYMGLGKDLYGLEDPLRQARRSFLQRILKDLGHPAGSHTFWPASLPTDDPDAPGLEPLQPQQATGPNAQKLGVGFAPDAPVFWSGVHALGARGVVVMGSAAVRALALPHGLHPLEQIRHLGHFVWILRDVEFLLNDEQGYRRMLSFLRSSLRLLIR